MGNIPIFISSPAAGTNEPTHPTCRKRSLFCLIFSMGSVLGGMVACPDSMVEGNCLLHVARKKKREMLEMRPHAPILSQ